MRTSDLVQRLQVARRELALERALTKLDKHHLLIFDDIAYLIKDQTSVLFELIGSRYERRSMLITANQPFGAWTKVFPDQAMTLAAIDQQDCPLCRPSTDNDDVGQTAHHFLCMQTKPVRIAAAITNVQAHVDALDPAQIFEHLAKRSEIWLSRSVIFGCECKHSDTPDRTALLRPRRQWPRRRDTAKPPSR
jgi:IstB-like ATP binding protein